MAYHRQQGVDTAIVRIFNTYGPRMRPHDGRAIPTFIRQALEEKPLTVFGSGSQTRSFCFVDDLVRGLILLAESGEHLPVNIGNPNEMTLLELAEAVVRTTGSSSPIVFEALPVDDPQVRQPDITRARQLLGWEPEIELDEGLAANARVARQEAPQLRRAALIAGRGSSRRGPRRCVYGAWGEVRPEVEVHPEGDLRRRADPVRQPGQGVSGAPAGWHAADSRQSLVGRAERGRPSAARPTRRIRPTLPMTGPPTTGRFGTRTPTRSASSSRSSAPRPGRTGLRAGTPPRRARPICRRS